MWVEKKGGEPRAESEDTLMLRAGGGEGKRTTSQRDLEGTNSEEEEKEDRVVSQCLVMKVSQAGGI